MKVLYITSLSGRRINSFMLPAISAAKACNIDITLACNMDGADKDGYEEDRKKYGFKIYHVDFCRNPLRISNLRAYKQIQGLLRKEKFDLIHCNTPIGGLIGRICGKIEHVPIVIYNVRGYHFYTGAPLKNWLLYYPIERFLAHYTDMIITINKQDYERSFRFHLKNNSKDIRLISVGVDVEKIKGTECDISSKRKELGVPDDAYVFVSVGELNKNKNHIAIIKAMATLNNPDIFYIICGSGEMEKTLLREAKDKKLENNVKLLGFRSDVNEILKASNCLIMPSLREGLGAAMLQGMASGLPCAGSRVGGIVDLIGDGELTFNPKSNSEIVNAMRNAMNQAIAKKEVERNQIRVKSYDTKKIIDGFIKVYEDCEKMVKKCGKR